MRQPSVYTATEIKNWDVDTEIESGQWVPARPLGHNCWSWEYRWQLAWKVLIGQLDALRWEDQ